MLQLWCGKWQGSEIVAKILKLRECTPRMSRDFKDEYPKLRFCSFNGSAHCCSLTTVEETCFVFIIFLYFAQCFLKCSDAVCWVTESASGLYKPVPDIGSRPSDHYFRSVCLSVCLFVQSFSRPSLIRFRSNLDICYTSRSSCVP